MTVVLLITTVICAIGWIICRGGELALIKYMLDKGYTIPSEEEVLACCMSVWRKMLHR